MRECGVWGPMPKMDGTELPPELAVRFPKSEEELRYLAYSDKIALVKEYSLSWSDKSCEDPSDIIHRFITGERRRAAQPATAKAEKSDDIWIPFVAVFGFLVFVLVLVKIMPAEAWISSGTDQK
ncbi:hypothetical protein PHLGIDRAFT_20565 [Phlebiopsis gigantea 11061_1 CR5-6]|uniref:Uncharacterized protein n=1 Tax=Phlebiopsis gigantea (strain 11061_1 CR5-6) TaxID=745531 RepID=A0A0C3RQB9_PHLG1|nr:hypothetical protein PHLGIDRAFT_20565 [Phlebiopsis gigantea 11061_1 CR5-6]